jgi:XTP/dITP diphosphohydrolase
LATSNPGKLLELRALLADLPVKLTTPDDLGLHLPVAETGATYTENASLKACAFATASGLPSLADDSGLEVEVLGGAPGLHSARYAPEPGASDADRRARLLQALAGYPQPWKATFRSTACLVLPNGETFFAEGTCHGQIMPTQRGNGGFGYDPIFLLPELDRTMAELGLDEKNRLSHRAKAIAKMHGFLSKITRTEQ